MIALWESSLQVGTCSPFTKACTYFSTNEIVLPVAKQPPSCLMREEAGAALFVEEAMGRTQEARGEAAGHTWRYVLKMCLADRVINSLIPIFYPKE